MKNILVLTDFSDNAFNAMAYAMQLFEGDSINFYVLYCKIPTSTYSTAEVVAAGNSSFYDSILKASREKLDTHIQNLKNEFNTKSFSFHPVVGYDSLVDATQSVIESKAIYMTIMGANGMTNAKNVAFGSNTVKLIQQISHPILAIPSNFTFNPIQNILLPLKDSDQLSRASFTGIVDFIKQFSQTVNALRICPKGKAPLEAKTDEKALNSLLDPVDFDYHTVKNVPLNYVVDCFIQTHEIDLILLLVSPEGFFERIFKDSTTKKIANILRVPLLVFPD